MTLMINVATKAQQHFIELLKTQSKGTQIRVFVIRPGTASAECGLSYCSADDIESDDLQLSFTKFSIIIDPQSAPFLKDTEINLVKGSVDSRLTIKAPHARLKKVADDAPLLDRVRYFVEAKINHKLAMHGGRVSVLEITQAGIVMIQFSGGCNGCSMVGNTLKNGVEQQLLSHFTDELFGVTDATEHQAGQHSFL